MVEAHNTSKLEVLCAKQLNTIDTLMRKNYLSEDEHRQWLISEISFIELYIQAGFHASPKFHQFQHMWYQMRGGAAPRFDYCFAEEGKNQQLAKYAGAVNNMPTLPEKVIEMHEQWVGRGCPTLPKLKKLRLSSMKGQ